MTAEAQSGGFVRLSPLPRIADIHFNASLALKAIEAARRRPHQSGQHLRPPQGRDRRPRRQKPASRGAFGANSVPASFLAEHTPLRPRAEDQAAALVESRDRGGAAARAASEFHDFKDLGQSSHVPRVIRAYRISRIRVPSRSTSASRSGTPSAARSIPRVAWAALLVDGIGDTVPRLGLPPTLSEIRLCYEKSQVARLRERGPGDDRVARVVPRLNVGCRPRRECR